MVEHVVCNDEIRVRFPAGPLKNYKNKMTKCILGKEGYAVALASKPLEGFNVYIRVTNKEAKKFRIALSEAGVQRRIPLIHLDEVLR
jgi:hypothetical protein